jgi:hypothetical protein
MEGRGAVVIVLFGRRTHINEEDHWPSGGNEIQINFSREWKVSSVFAIIHAKFEDLGPAQWRGRLDYALRCIRNIRI